MNPALAKAIEIFRELGWDGAPVERVPDLPIGTPEQQRLAREGLRSGDWGHFGAIGPNTVTWVSDVGVDPHLLGLFAIRVGVDARRAVELAPNARDVDDEVLLACLLPRGPQFAVDFVRRTCLREWRRSDRSSSPYGPVSVRLADLHDLPVPAEVGYLLDWTVVAGWALGEDVEIVPPRAAPPSEAEVRRRYLPHVRAAVAAGVAGTGALPGVIAAGVRRGWIERAEALSLAFAALDAAARPSDRKAWSALTVSGLEVTDIELLDEADALVAALSTGEAPVVEMFAPRLLGVVPDDLLGDVLVASLTARTKKALRAVLAAAAVRRPPAPLVDELVAVLEPLLVDRDKAVAAAARKVVQAWGAAPPDVVVETPVATGRWRATPPLWQVPRFELGEVTPEALTDAAALLVARREMGVDPAAERFLALANLVARRDREAARRALRGVPATWEAGMSPVAAWVAGRPAPVDEHGPAGPLHARLVGVLHRLGEVPCLLSTPSRDDLRIDPADLVDRLRMYDAAGVDAVEADVLVAVLRLDPALLTDEARAALRKSKVRARTVTGRRMRPRIGALALDHLADPVREPELVLHGSGRRWTRRRITPPASLEAFPPRLQAIPDRSDEILALWPHWQHLPAWGLAGNLWPVPGLAWRQLVRRAAPIGPSAAINLLGALRTKDGRIAAEVALAVREAWERGLLRPGDADVRYLDWALVPTQLAALASALLDLAEEGLASVVWPVLDDLVTSSLAAPRFVAGTAEVAEALRELVPEALAAVASGLADASVLDVPGLRALAARGGSSRAVVAARETVALLPVRASADPVPAQPAPDVDLSRSWPEDAGLLPAVPDGVRLTAQWQDPTAGTKMLAFDLVLPDLPDRVFRVVKGWTYDLETEGQCQARDGDATVYLYWDGTRVAVSGHRDRVHAEPGPLQLAGPTPPLTVSMVAVAVGMVGQDGDRGLVGEHLLEQLVRTNRIGAPAVRIAMGQLLGQADVSPARLVRVVEKRPHLLPTLWPVLTEPIRAAGLSDEPPPRWLNQVLVVATAHALILRAAAAAGRLPADAAAWPGLTELAARPGKSAALVKARSLQTLLS